MIVKFLKPSTSFAGVFYNMNKVDKSRAELMKAANFRALAVFTSPKLQDYINYLEMITSVNERIEYPQLHVTISGKGRMYDKQALTGIAEGWLREMGYAEQPFLLVFHKDTSNNHLHIVSTRIDRNGKKISSAFEHRRSMTAINQVLGYSTAMKYHFSTKAQFLMVLETLGFPGKDPDKIKVLERAAGYKRDLKRTATIRALLEQHKADPQMKQVMKEAYGIDILFHAAEGKPTYGYSIVDHERKIVFKGSEVMPLRELLSVSSEATHAWLSDEMPNEGGVLVSSGYIPPIAIADDVDDQQVHGMRRRRQKKARTNTR
ncbi:relaxase/mobilization nuclease domain-containing protein [Mucilaginibacter sp. P25]|uniref:relaxase/mobilization nuclease domain-containing protein n=1 Tax=Mucilaginibacter sp. P25 TaxID=3423945 RepID=UPI003D78F4F3